MKLKTKSGFTIEFDENRAKDWNFAKHLALCEKPETQVLGITYVIPALLGVEGEKALAEHVKDANGFVSTEKMILEFKEILELSGDNLKKS